MNVNPVTLTKFAAENPGDEERLPGGALVGDVRRPDARALEDQPLAGDRHGRGPGAGARRDRHRIPRQGRVDG
jgi:hypothetical protein